jgi:hypothetical protein
MRSTWRQWVTSSHAVWANVTVTAERCKYVGDAIYNDWKQHHASSGNDPSVDGFDLSWEEVELYWERSGEAVLDKTVGKHPVALESQLDKVSLNRHSLLATTEHATWSQSPVRNSPRDREGSIVFHLRELRNVPLSELLLNFPESSIHMKPLDVVKLYVYAAVGLSVLQAT